MRRRDFSGGEITAGEVIKQAEDAFALGAAGGGRRRRLPQPAPDRAKRYYFRPRKDVNAVNPDPSAA